MLRTCARCNNGSTASDEEFGVMLNLLANDPTKEEGAHLDRAQRSLLNQRKMLSSILATTEKVLLTTESGIIAGPGYTFRWPLRRLISTADKIARLLYFHHLQRPVPPHLKVETFGIDAVGKPFGKELEKRTALLDLAQDCKVEPTEFPEIFTYRWGVTKDHPEASVWITTFMRRVVFVTFITPPSIQTLIPRG